MSPMLNGMTEYIKAGEMFDFQDHYYPSEMAVDAQIQTFLIRKDVDAFLKDLIQIGCDTIEILFVW